MFRGSFFFAFIELGEAADAWKKGLSEETIAEELMT